MDDEEPPITYFKELISQHFFEPLLKTLKEVCVIRYQKMYGKTYEVRRISCVYNFSEKEFTSYGLNALRNPPEEIIKIREMLQEETGQTFDYVLAHIYRGPTDALDYHFDKEALGSHILSVSLGATRRFQVRKRVNPTQIFEYDLASGDVVWMRKGCQEEYEHRIPKMSIKDIVAHIESEGIEIPKGRKTFKMLNKVMEEKDIIPVRINLTFRQLDRE